MKILVTDGMDKTALEQLKQNGHEVTEQFYPPEELGAALKEYDAVVVRSATKIRANHIDVRRLPRGKSGVCRLCAGKVPPNCGAGMVPESGASYRMTAISVITGGLQRQIYRIRQKR